MILGGSMARRAGLPTSGASGFIAFPLVVHALDCVVTAFGILSVSASARRAATKTPKIRTKF